MTNGLANLASHDANLVDLSPCLGIPVHWFGEITPCDVVTISAAFIAVLGIAKYWYEKRVSRTLQRREIYQQLELASIDLFKFEIENRALLACVWEPDTPSPPEGSPDAFAVGEYIACILNLFEMACSFTRQGIMSPDVFVSWLPWIYEMVCSPQFRTRWPDNLELQYTQPLRELVASMLPLAEAGIPAPEALRKLPSASASVLRCRHVRCCLHARFR